MMKGFMKWFVLAVLFLILVPVVSGYSVSEITIDPSGSLTPGTHVAVSYKIQFSASGSETFPSSDELQMSTDLEKPTWTWTLILDGVENPRPSAGGRMLTLSGFELSYPSKVDQAMRVTMEGTVPSIDKTTNKSIIKILEKDSNGRVIDSSTVERTAFVINVAEVSQAIASKKGDLQTFRSHIDEKAAVGVDTSVAEVKYNDANAKIAAAAALPSSQYAAALNYLNTASSLMTDGEKALDKSWAENEVANSQTPISNVDGVIGWFKGNKSTADLPSLQPIISKREIAVSYLSTANDEIASGNYAQARNKAAEAYAKANESYNEALDLQKKTMSGFDIGGMFSGILKSGVVIVVVAVVAIVLIAAGIIVYRKRSQWDELG